MNTPRDIAWTQGVIDTIYSTMGALRGQGDGKVFHRYALNSAEELAWHQGCHFAAQRMMEGAMMAQALRSES